MKMLPTVILAGGLATRLGAATQSCPKALLDVGGQPFIHHQLRRLADEGIERVVLCIGHLGEQIADAVGDGRRFGINVEYAWDGPALRGTAGAIRNALPRLGDAFFVMYGDSYLTCDFTAVQASFRRAGKEALMTVYHNRGAYDRSNVAFADGRIRDYCKDHATPAMQHIDYGLSAFTAAAFDGPAPRAESDLAQVFERLLRAGQLAAHEVPERFYEIGSPAGLEEARRLLAPACGVES
jgi:MurNAc alpha-1-phosphate uridylyltransferase